MNKAPAEPSVQVAATLTQRRPRRFWLWLRLTTLGILLFVASFLALVGSKAGLQLLWLVQPQLLPALQIKTLEGDIWQGITLRELSYQQSNLQVSLAELQVRLDLACLWRRQLCLSLLQLQGLDVVQSADKSAAAAPDVLPAEAQAQTSS